MKPSWDECDWWTQELILAYDAGRQMEEDELAIALAKSRA